MQDQSVLVVLEFLQRRGFVDAMLALERESQTTRERLPHELQFLREVLLEGDFERVLKLIIPLKSQLHEDQFRSLLIAIRKQQLYELIQKLDPEQLQVVVQGQYGLKELCSRNEYKSLISLLSLNSARQDPSLVDWSVSRGRLRTFNFLKDCLLLYCSDIHKNSLQHPRLEDLLAQQAPRNASLSPNSRKVRRTKEVESKSQRLEKKPEKKEAGGSQHGNRRISANPSINFQIQKQNFFKKKPQLSVVMDDRSKKRRKKDESPRQSSIAESESKASKQQSRSREREREKQPSVKPRESESKKSKSSRNEPVEYFQECASDSAEEQRSKIEQQWRELSHRKSAEEQELEWSGVGDSKLMMGEDLTFGKHKAKGDNSIPLEQIINSELRRLDQEQLRASRDTSKRPVTQNPPSRESSEPRLSQHPVKLADDRPSQVQVQNSAGKASRTKKSSEGQSLKPPETPQKADITLSALLPQPLRNQGKKCSQSVEVRVYKEQQSELKKSFLKDRMRELNEEVFQTFQVGRVVQEMKLSELGLVNEFIEDATIRMGRFSPGNSLLAYGTNNSMLKVYSVRQAAAGKQTPLHVFEKIHLGSVFCLDFSADQKLIATCSNDSTVKLVNLGREVPSVEKLGWHNNMTARSVAFSASGRDVFSCGEDGILHIWDVEKKISKGDYGKERLGILTCLKEQGGLIYLGGLGRTLFMVDPRTDLLVSSAPLDSQINYFDIYSGMIVSAHKNGQLQHYDLSFKQLARAQPHQLEIRSVRPHPQEGHLITSSFDGTIALLTREDALGGGACQSLQAHSDKAVFAEFSPCGQFVVSTSTDCTCKLWQL